MHAVKKTYSSLAKYKERFDRSSTSELDPVSALREVPFVQQ